MTSGEDGRFDWRGGGAAAGALLAALILLGMVFLVAMSNNARDEALNGERHAYDVTLLTRSLDATISRSEAALGRFVLDEQVATSGNIYYSQWRLAGQQIYELGKALRREPSQRERLSRLQTLFRKRGDEFALAARATVAGRGAGGTSYYYAAAQSPTGPALRLLLSDIANAERKALKERMNETRFFAARASRLTDYLSWLGVIVGAMAIFLGAVAVQALRLNAVARREAESEAERSLLLEQAVADRTRELSDANLALKAEAVERQAAEAQLRQVQKMEAVGQLTGGIAHDFNNMLAVVVGGIDLARRRLNGPRSDVMIHLTNAMEGATRAAALTRRLLSFARSEPLLPKRVDSAALVGGMSELMDRTLGERIEVRTALDAAAWPVFVDPHQLENAILNLAVNGRDAMDGEGQLVISTANETLAANAVGDIQQGDYLKISVTDTGCGMSPEVIERAFEPFFTTKQVGKGTGLGLSQIFGFAHQSGGEVGIDSIPGRGTTVSIYLPRTQAEETNVRLHPAAHRQEADVTVPGARILLVEDDPRVRTATVGALEDLGYDPVSSSSGAEAMRLFLAQDFDLVISDVVMPEMTGPELIRELRARRPDIAVLFVTGFVGDGENDELVGSELLRKPFTVAALASAVAQALSPDASGSHPISGAAAAG
ncbi:MAG: ATP-binding protein [Pseudomonadota bacterium]|nr:ATP-binding protein [Pseudomonadota bacterium]